MVRYSYFKIHTVTGGGMFSSMFRGIKLTRNNAPEDYRSDIDGLRAIAILLVVGYHYFPWRMQGGFIGVDIFFVISGYLITKIILIDLNNGTFRLTRFFSRRILRLFPALICVLFCLIIFGGLAFTSVEYKALGKHLIGSTLFISNFFFWFEAGYFDENALFKPLLHLWSLGIEEQYYLIWPIVLMAAQKHLKGASTAIVIAIGLSFALNVYYLDAEKGFAFYMPFTRGWELLIGAALSHRQWLAYQKPQDVGNGTEPIAKKVWLVQFKSIISLFANRIAPYLGMGLIAVGVLWLDDQTPYPGYYALLPTVGACLLIAGPANTWLHRSVLSHPALVWLGLISYPLYLWHWPLLSVATLLDTQLPSRGVRIALMVTAIALAWLTYKFVERPIRRYVRPSSITVLMAGMFFAGSIGALIYFSKGLPQRYGIEAFEKKFDQFEFSMDAYPSAACKKAFPNSGWCSYGKNETPSVALIGDSHAHHFFPGLEKVFSLHDENLVLLGSSGCPPLLDIASHKTGGDDWCVKGNSYINTIADDKNIHTVILSAIWHLYMSGKGFTDDISTSPYWQIDGTDKAAAKDGEATFDRQFKKTLKRLLGSNKKVIVIKQVPVLNFHPKACLDRPVSFIEARDCRMLKAQVDAYQKEYETAFDALVGQFPGVMVLDPAEYMCGDTHCAVYIEGDSLYRDSNHLSLFGSDHLARKWGPLLD